jgi:lysophospholipase L1-like esterase
MTLLILSALFHARSRRAARPAAVILLTLAAVSCPRFAHVAEAAGSGPAAGAWQPMVDAIAEADEIWPDGGADVDAAGGDEAAFVHVVPLEGGPMERFYAALARADRGGEEPARVVHYGDSHTAADLLTGALRRALQDRFGDGGRGFVALGRPWKSYRPKDVEIAASGGNDWRAERILVAADPATLDGRYGLGGVCTIGSRRGAFARVATARGGDFGTEAASFDIHYLVRRGGGSFDVLVDGRRVGTVATNGGGPRSGFFRTEAGLGPHALEVRLRGDGEVRLFGVAIEGGGPGIVYDSLGVNGAFFYTPLRWDGALLAEGIERRDPDLIVAMYGSNEVDSRTITEESYREDVRRVMARFRAGAPDASCLLLGPPDRRGRDARTGAEQLGWIIEAQRDVAEELGCGFIDLQALMGGAGARDAWQRHGLAQPDGVHLTARGYRVVGERLAEQIIAAYEEYREGDPLAGTEQE